MSIFFCFKGRHFVNLITVDNRLLICLVQRDSNIICQGSYQSGSFQLQVTEDSSQIGLKRKGELISLCSEKSSGMAGSRLPPVY
jgi:hypothetical protein